MIIVLLEPIAGVKILEMVFYLVQCLKLMFLFFPKVSLFVRLCSAVMVMAAYLVKPINYFFLFGLNFRCKSRVGID